MTSKIQSNQAIFEKKTLTLGFVLFLLIIFMRSIILILPRFQFLSLSLFEIFGIISSYLLALIILINFRTVLWNRTNFIVLVFILYCFLSILWGSSIKEVSRIILPFIMIFLVSFLIREKQEINTLYKFIFISFLLPIFYSSYVILTGKGYVDYWTGIERFSGGFQGPHVLAYSMLFFIFFSTLYLISDERLSKNTKILICITILISLFCIYKSYTRTVYVGIFIFTIFLIIGLSQKKMFTVFLLSLLLMVLSLGQLNTIFWKSEERDIEKASSGRTELWEHNLNVFNKMSFPQKTIGLGLGAEGRYIKEFNTKIKESHNDYLSLIMNLGVLGLIIYLVLIVSVLIDILKSEITKKIKFTFLGIMVSVITMNFLSNAIIFRLEFSQYFWIIIGLFYRLNDITSSCIQNSQFLEKSKFGLR